MTKNGRVAIVDTAGKRGKDWRALVQLVAQEHMNGTELFQGALALSVTFVMPRPRGHFGKRGLRDSAPAYPTTRPDVDKLSRAIMDALKHVAYRDDAQVIMKQVTKVYGERPGAHVVLREA